MIGLISATAAGAAARDRLAAAWPDRTRVYDGPVADAVRAAFAECDRLVCFLATGAVVRLVAPLLHGKTDDPGVVCVDEAGRFAVSLLGGHGGGANELAREVGEVLGAEPVVTTATDAVGARTRHAGSARGGRCGGRVAGAAGRGGGGAARRGDVAAAAAAGRRRGRVHGAGDGPAGRTGRRGGGVAAADARRRGRRVERRPVEEVLGLVGDALREAGLSAASVAELATVDAKAGEPGLVEAARRLGVPLVTHAAEELARVAVPNPSDAPLAAVGTPSVAEAAALVGGGELLLPKRKSAPPPWRPARSYGVRGGGGSRWSGSGPARGTCSPRGRGTNCGARPCWWVSTSTSTRSATCCGPARACWSRGSARREERARTAVEEARRGQAVALIGSGDAGVYAMASPALAEASDDIDVVGVPGVTAALAAGALLGAPLGHDHVSISLSDLHTPWEVIERRVRAAAEADLVVTFYNPRSRGRDWQLPKALAVLAGHRSPATPVGVVRNASRADESVRLTTLAALDPATVDMMTVVTVGNTATRDIAGRMVTPRGYRWQEETR